MRRVRLTGVLLTVVLAAVACGDGNDDDADAEGTASALATRPPAPTIDIAARDYFYEGVPDSVPFGSTIALINDSESEFHTLHLVYFGLDETPLDELATLDYLPLLFEVAQPTSVLLSMPGEPAYGHLIRPPWQDPVVRKPGRWVIFCGVWLGADPVELQETIQATSQPPPAIEGAPRHYTTGMIADFIVEEP
jgi:hypothetical protein